MDVSVSTRSSRRETSGMPFLLLGLVVLAVCMRPVCALAEFKPPRGESWWARFGYQPYLIHDIKPIEKTLAIASTGESELVFDYTAVLADYYRVPLADKITGTVTIPAGSKLGQVKVPVPALGKLQQYRLHCSLKERGSGLERQITGYLVSEVRDGPRRELILEDGQWQKAMVTELADSPPKEGWVEGGYIPSLDAKKYKGFWVRRRFSVPKWLRGAQYELYFGEVTYACDVYLNGEKLGYYVSPCHPFSIDVPAAKLRRNAENVLELRVQDVRAGIKDPENRPASYAGWNFMWPLHAHYSTWGVLQEVRLRTYPKVNVSDVFVKTSVTDSRLDVGLAVTNSSDVETDVELKLQVEDVGRVVLTLPTRKLHLAGGETKELDVSQGWKNPKLWWPWTTSRPVFPDLYRLRCRIEQNGEVVDELSTRFGFREIRIVGRHFQFNGRRFKTRIYSMPYLDRANHQEAFNTLTNTWFGYHKNTDYSGPPSGYSGPLMWRHIHPVPMYRGVLDVADEIGVIITEGSTLGSVKSNWADPQMWKNYQGMLKKLFDKSKNHPSIISWSLENETLMCTNMWPAMYGSNQKNLLQLGRFMQGLDPTRPIQFDGDSDIDGTWSTMNLHYPHLWWVRPDLPNSAFWLNFGVKDAPCDAPYPFRISWTKPKPIILGEDGLYIAAFTPHDFSPLTGEEAYPIMHKKGYWGGEEQDSPGHAMLVEGYRDAEVSITSTMSGGTGGLAVQRAHIAVRSFVRQRNSRFYAGSKVTRNITLHHDELFPAEVTFVWKLKQADSDQVLAEGKQAYQMQSCELKRFEVTFNTPEVKEATKLQFMNTVLRNGKEMFSETHDYMAFPAERPPIELGGVVGLYDRSGQTAQALKGLGVKYEFFGTIEPWMNPLKDISCLVVGIGTDVTKQGLGDFVKGVKPWVRSGGVLVWLRHDQGDDWLPVTIKQDARRTTTITFPRMKNHPVLKGIGPEMLRYWGEDNIISTKDYLKAPTIAWRPIIDAGGPGGLKWSPLLEVRYGKGRIILCQMRLIDKLKDEPAAAALLRNILEYATRHKPGKAGKAKLIADKGSKLGGKLYDVGLKDLASDDQADLIIVDAAAKHTLPDTAPSNVMERAFDSLPGELRKHLDGGGTVLLHGLTPTNIDRWRKLLPLGIELTESNALHAIRTNDDPLLAGISATELWWSQFSLWANYKETGTGVEVAYSVKLPKDAKGPRELVGPGALVSIPVGEGRLLIDQLLWEKDDVPVKRANLYIALLLENLLGGYPKH